MLGFLKRKSARLLHLLFFHSLPPPILICKKNYLFCIIYSFFFFFSVFLPNIFIFKEMVSEVRWGQKILKNYVQVRSSVGPYIFMISLKFVRKYDGSQHLPIFFYFTMTILNFFGLFLFYFIKINIFRQFLVGFFIN